MASRFEDLVKNNRNKKNRKKTPAKDLPLYCVFCKNNGESPKVYNSHVLKTKTGNILCPVSKAEFLSEGIFQKKWMILKK